MSTPSGTPENPFSDDRRREDADRAGDATGGEGSLPSYNAYAGSGPTGPANDYTSSPMTGSAYPGPGVRLGALLIDFVAVWIVTLIISVIFVDFGSGTISIGAQIVLQLVSLVIWLAYRVGMEVTTGASLGKMALKIKVVDADGKLLTAGASFKRNSWYIAVFLLGMFVGSIGQIVAVILVAVLGFTIARNPFRQHTFDQWSKAYVVNA
jgi:uncharacterized RDD family membrane protein YckC